MIYYRQIWALLLCFGLSLHATAKSQGDEWTLEKEESGIKVYTRMVPKLRLKAFHATTTVQASQHEVVKFFEDFSSHTKWQHHCAEAKVIRRDEEEVVVYIRFDMPAFMPDRDCVRTDL